MPHEEKQNKSNDYRCQKIALSISFNCRWLIKLDFVCKWPKSASEVHVFFATSGAVFT